MFVRSLRGLLLAALSLLCAVVVALPPSQDPFYQPPSGFASKPLGAILRSRQVQIPGVTGLTGTTAFQLLYRTTSAEGKPLATVTTVVAPSKPAPGVPKILAVATAQDTANVDCSPSYGLAGGLEAGLVGPATSGTVIATIQAGLFNGWYLTIPDHEGPNGTFIAGYAEGRAMLDGIRALFNHRPTLPTTKGARVVITGYSGGGHATAWAAQLASTYGKGLPIVGTAAGGVPVDLDATVRNLNGGPFAAFGALGIVGAANAYPELNDFLNSIATRDGKAKLAEIRKACLADALLKFAFLDVFKLTDVADPFSQPTAKKYFDLNYLGADPKTFPVKGFPQYLFHSESDQVIPYGPVVSHYQKQCKAGASIHFATTKLSDHVSMTYISVPAAVDWSKQALDGTLKQDGCFEEHRFALLLNSPQALAAVGPDAMNSLLRIQKRDQRERKRR